MVHQLATVGLGPLLLAQGIWARKRTPRLPEAVGPRSGVSGHGPALRLLIVGDSAAAGVGAPHQERALAGCLTKVLASRYRVAWKLFARTGATTASTLARLPELDGTRFDLAVTSLGVNDVIAAHGLATWRRQQRALRRLLRESLGVEQVVVSGLPPVSRFPALPQPLRWYLGRRAAQFDAVLAGDVEADAGAEFVDLSFATDKGLMAEDGFHPGPDVYSEWARRIAEKIA